MQWASIASKSGMEYNELRRGGETEVDSCREVHLHLPNIVYSLRFESQKTYKYYSKFHSARTALCLSSMEHLETFYHRFIMQVLCTMCDFMYCIMFLQIFSIWVSQPGESHNIAHS